MKKSNIVLRIISDFAVLENLYDNEKNIKMIYVQNLVVPNILGVTDVMESFLSFSESNPAYDKYWERRIKDMNSVKGEMQPRRKIHCSNNVFMVSVCLGVDVTSKTIDIFFTTKARAEVCRDNILEAIDEYWTSHV